METTIISMNGLGCEQLDSGLWRVWGRKTGPLGRLTTTALELNDALLRYVSGDYDPIEVKIEKEVLCKGSE